MLEMQFVSWRPPVTMRQFAFLDELDIEAD